MDTNGRKTIAKNKKKLEIPIQKIESSVII